jgi:hypothetical protein
VECRRRTDEFGNLVTAWHVIEPVEEPLPAAEQPRRIGQMRCKPRALTLRATASPCSRRSEQLVIVPRFVWHSDKLCSSRFAYVATVTYQKDPRVDEYINALPAWQQDICQQVRDLVHAVDPEVVETIKRRVQPYFVLQGNICALLAAKDHVNVFLYDGAIVPDPEDIITAGHDNKTARMVSIRQNEKINTHALGEMFRQIIANNRAGGWRKIKRDAQMDTPGQGSW